MDPTTAVVHVLGEADTGLARATEMSDAERAAWADGWRSTLDSAVAGGDHALAAAVVQGTEPHRQPGAFRLNPLPTLLAALPAGVDLLLVATAESTGGRHSERTALSLATAVDRFPDVFGVPVACVRVVTVDGFRDAEVADPVESALAVGPRVPVVMSTGSGSTGLFLSALAGVVASGRPWQVRSVRAPDARIELLPDGPDPLIAWLLRLGHPERVAERPGVPADVAAYATALAACFDRVATGRPDHRDLAEWARSDLRRRDGTSGLAVRAWIEAEYQHRRTLDGAADVPDLLVDASARLKRENARRPTFGTLMSDLRHRTPTDVRRRFPSADWLCSKDFSDAIRASRGSAHQRTVLPLDTSRLVARLLDDIHAPGCVPPPSLPVFGHPVGSLAVVWPVAPRGNRHPPYAATLGTRRPGGDLRTAVGVDDRATVDLQCVLLHTTELVDAAADQLAIIDAPGGWAGSPFTDARGVAVEIADLDDRAAASRVRAALDGLSPQPDAVVVVPVGAKELTAACLAGAVAYAGDLAVPLLVESTNHDDGAAPTYHRVVRMLHSDGLLLDLGIRALERLEFDTAARLVGLTSPGLRRSFLSRIERLGTQFRSATGADPAKRTSKNVVVSLDVAYRRWTTSTSETDRVRIVHAAAEVIAAQGRDPGPCSARLTHIRNRLPVNHPDGSGRVEQPTAELFACCVTEWATHLGEPRTPGSSTNLEGLIGDLRRRLLDVGRIVRSASADVDISGPTT